MIHYISHKNLSDDYFDDAHITYQNLIYILTTQSFLDTTLPHDKKILQTAIQDLCTNEYTLSYKDENAIVKTKKTFVKSFVSQDRLNIHIVVSTILDNKPISSNIKLNIDDIEDIVKFVDKEDFQEKVSTFKQFLEDYYMNILYG